MAAPVSFSVLLAALFTLTLSALGILPLLRGAIYQSLIELLPCFSLSLFKNCCLLADQFALLVQRCHELAQRGGLCSWKHEPSEVLFSNCRLAARTRFCKLELS